MTKQLIYFIRTFKLEFRKYKSCNVRFEDDKIKDEMIAMRLMHASTGLQSTDKLACRRNFIACP